MLWINISGEDTLINLDNVSGFCIKRHVMRDGFRPSNAKKDYSVSYWTVGDDNLYIFQWCNTLDEAQRCLSQLETKLILEDAKVLRL